MAAIDRFHRNAWLLGSGQFVSQMGDAVFLGAVACLAQALTGSGSSTGLTVFLAAVPYLLLGPVAGAWVDRGEKRRVMIASDLLRAALLVPLPFVAGLVGLSFPLVAAVAFLLACFSTPFQPARDALLPTLAEGRPLVRVNAIFQVSAQLSGIVGLFLGGFVLGGNAKDVDRIVWVIAADGATFLASALALSLMALPPEPAGAPEVRRTFLHDVLDGLREVKRDPLLPGLLVLTALDNLAIMGPAVVGATLFILDDLHLGPGHLAWFEGAMGAGYLVGAVLVGRFGVSWPKGKTILWGMVLDGLTYVPFVWVRSWPLALALIFVHGLFIPWIVVARTSLLQGHVPAARLGRVFALVSLTVAGMTALSALVTGALADLAGPRATFLAAGGFGALCGLVGLVVVKPLARDR